jgi:serine/threonine protein kinase
MIADRIAHVPKQVMVDSSKRWKEISALYAAALERPDAQRDAFLTEACAGDTALREEVESLLHHHGDGQQFMTIPAAQVVANAMAGDLVSLVGRRLGAYRIDAPLAAGGMGEVYRATDTRLQRAVAIKILPPHLREDVSLRDRFEREAQTLAALRHPHICVLYDVGRENGIDFLVMELLDGETMAEQLARGPLPIPIALQHALQIAEALGAVHRHGIVHRDLKPGNVMVTEAGAKLFDFGLAKPSAMKDAKGSALGHAAREAPSPTPLADTSAAGTLPYMTPEQLDREETDRRSDLFAFGCVLYEMVTGQKAFDAPDKAGVAAAIRNEEPAALPPQVVSTAPGLDAVIRKCLRKNPDDRWQDAEALADALRQTLSATTSAGSRPSQWWPSVAVLLVTLTLAAGLVVWSGRNDRDSPVSANVLQLGQSRQLTASEELELDPSFSPNADMIAYSAGHGTDFRIAVRDLRTNRVVPVAGPETSQFQPRWSPDGRELLYITTDGVFITSPGDGQIRQIAPASDARGVYSVLKIAQFPTGAAWSPDGRDVAVAYGGTLLRISVDGGSQRQLVTTRYELHGCDWSPDAQWIACTSGNTQFAYGQDFGNTAPTAVVLVSAAGGALIEVAPRTSMNQSPIWSKDGRRLYFLSNRQGPSDIYAVHIGTDGAPLGDAVRLTTGLSASAIAISADRSMLSYTVLTARANVWSLAIPPAGTSTDIALARARTSGNHVIEAAHVTRDRKWLVYDSNLQGSFDLFRMPLEGGEATRLTGDPSDEFAPVVSPDGRWLAFHSWRTGSRDIFVQPFDGGPTRQLTATSGQESYPRWLADGSLAFLDQAPEDGGSTAIALIPSLGDGSWGPPGRLGLPRGADIPSVTRDNQWVFARNGAIEVMRPGDPMVRTLYAPTTSQLPQAQRLALSEDGNTVFFKTHDMTGRAAFWSLPLSGGTPTLLVRFDDLSRPSRRFDFDVADGHFFFTIEDRRSNIWIADVTEQ